jgi:hypothetical protein
VILAPMRPHLIALALLCAAGCGGRAAIAATFETAAASRAAIALSCPPDAVSAEYLGGGGVTTRGCGQTQSYTCSTTIVARQREASCVPDGPPQGTHVDPGLTDDQRVVFGVVSTCPGMAGATVSLDIGVEGDVLRCATSQPSVRECACESVSHLRFTERSDAAHVEVLVPAAAPQEIVTPPPPTPSATDALVRARIDSLHDAILACTGGAATAVVGEWSTDGSLLVHLQGARAGTPEDGCVRAAAAHERLDPPPTASGSVLHPIH